MRIKKNQMEAVPEDLLLHILSFLSSGQFLKRFATTSSYLCNIVFRSQIWNFQELLHEIRSHYAPKNRERMEKIGLIRWTIMASWTPHVSILRDISLGKYSVEKFESLFQTTYTREDYVEITLTETSVINHLLLPYALPKLEIELQSLSELQAAFENTTLNKTS